MPSFDAVSSVNMQEVVNAVDQVAREILQRYDFKDSGAEITLEQKEKRIILKTPDQMKLQALQQMLREKMAKRGVSQKLLEFKDEQKAGGDTLRQEVLIKDGLTSEELKQLSKIIKDSKLKIQAQIQQQQLRVTGKKRDDLQQAIQVLKQNATQLELQFINFRD